MLGVRLQAEWSTGGPTRPQSRRSRAEGFRGFASGPPAAPDCCGAGSSWARRAWERGGGRRFGDARRIGRSAGFRRAIGTLGIHVVRQRRREGCGEDIEGVRRSCYEEHGRARSFGSSRVRDVSEEWAWGGAFSAPRRAAWRGPLAVAYHDRLPPPNHAQGACVSKPALGALRSAIPGCSSCSKSASGKSELC